MTGREFEECLLPQARLEQMQSLWEELDQERGQFVRNLENVYRIFREEEEASYSREREQAERLAALIASKSFPYAYTNVKYRDRIEGIWKKSDGRFRVLESEEELREVYNLLCGMVKEYQEEYEGYVRSLRKDVERVRKGLDAEHAATLDSHMEFMLSMEMYNRLVNAGG